VASYTVNERAIETAKRLIESRQYVLDSDWGEVQPDAAAENVYLDSTRWNDYGEWHLAFTDPVRPRGQAGCERRSVRPRQDSVRGRTHPGLEDYGHTRQLLLPWSQVKALRQL
jgi:hypothetical protein